MTTPAQPRHARAETDPLRPPVPDDYEDGDDFRRLAKLMSTPPGGR